MPRIMSAQHWRESCGLGSGVFAKPEGFRRESCVWDKFNVITESYYCRSPSNENSNFHRAETTPPQKYLEERVVTLGCDPMGSHNFVFCKGWTICRAYHWVQPR